MITAIILAKNEENNIENCLKSLGWCDEIIVIDDYSSDNTRQIAKKYKAKIISRSLNNDFAGQRNFALGKAKNNWVLFVDADEIISSELSKEIAEKILNTKNNGFFFKRTDFFLGKKLKFGETRFVRILRLARKNSGKWKRNVDEIWEIKGETAVLANPLLHYSHNSLNQFLHSLKSRAKMNADFYALNNNKLSFYDWLKPLAKFIQNYFLRLGFLDGIYGFVFAVLMSLHSFLVRAILYVEYTHKKTINTRKPKREELIFALFSAVSILLYFYFLIQKGFLKWLK